MEQTAIPVLLIEDDPDDAVVVRRLMAPRGDIPYRFELSTARTLGEAMAALRGADERLVVLTDLFLPDSRGLDTFRALSAYRPDLPVVVLTSLNDERAGLEAMRLGAQDYLVKDSLDGRTLQRSVRYAVERRRLFDGFRGAMERAPDAILTVDRDGVIQWVNPAAEKLLGKPAASLIGGVFGHEPSPVETREEGFDTPAGRRAVELRWGEVDWSGRRAWLVWMRDVTEIKRLAQVQAEVRERRKVESERDQFVSAVSHELRSPLAIIDAALENIAEGLVGPLPEKAMEMVALAQRNVRRLSRVVGNLLEIARLQSGKAQMNRRRVDAALLIRDTVSGFQLVERRGRIAITQAAAEGLPPMHADADLFVQVLSNMLDNACRFARSKVEVSATADVLAPVSALAGADRPRPAVRVTVRDDGPGIPPEQLRAIFDRFVQVQRAISASGYKGTGLGLAICKEIVERHDGRIWAESEPGRGTTFHFIIPAYAE